MSAPQPQPTPGAGVAPRRGNTAALGLFALALAVRWIYLADAANSPVFATPIVDAETYDSIARAALQHGRLDMAFFWQPFFYPAFLTFVYALSDGSILAAKLIQTVIGALTCVLTFRLATRLLPPRWAWAAGAATALCGPLVFYDGELLATGWAAFWCVALPLLALDCRQAPTPRRCAMLGLAAGLAILTRPPFIPVVAALALWSLWPPRAPAPRPPPRRLALHAALLALGLLVVTLPVAWLSRQATGSFSVLPYSGGLNLYIGNNPQRDATLAVRPGWDWDTLTLLPARHGIPPGRETSRFFAQQVRAYVREYPVHFLQGLATKTLHLLSPRELPRNVDLYTLTEWTPTLGLLVWRLGPWGFPFGVILPLALLGLLARGRRAPLPTWMPLILYAGGVVLVFATTRYRSPLLPLLLIHAVVGVKVLVDWRRSHPARAALALALAATASLLTALPGPFPQERNDYRAELFYCLGGIQNRRGQPAEAERLLREALTTAPAHPDALNSLGVSLERQDRLDEAERAYRDARRANPRNRTILNNLAGIRYRQEDYLEAEGLYRLVIDQAPRHAQAHQQLAMCLIQQGRMADAVEPLYAAIQLDPRNAALHNNLGSALNHAGNAREAIKHFEAAILLDPNLMLAVDNLGSMLEGQQRLSDARILYRAALERAGARGQEDRVEHYRRKLDRLTARSAP